MVLRTVALMALAVGMYALVENPASGQDKKEPAKPKPEDLPKVKKALSEVQEFIGAWDLERTEKVGAATKASKEKVSWSWKFAKDDVYLTVAFDGKDKQFTGGSLRYDVAKKKYVLALTPTTDKAEQVFEGDVKNGTLKVERKDMKGDVHRLTLTTLDDGIRFQVKYQKQEGGKGLAQDVFAMNGKKEGVMLAGAKKPECIVSGGAANIAVQYNGKTYYVCCTGCRDEFNANPKKYAK